MQRKFKRYKKVIKVEEDLESNQQKSDATHRIQNPLREV